MGLGALLRCTCLKQVILLSLLKLTHALAVSLGPEISVNCINPENSFITGENIVVDGGMTKKMIYV
jgi:NAD(P)-dependent dehydrogenase (short-subunit alcohol dehydrogenase family)